VVLDQVELSLDGGSWLPGDRGSRPGRAEPRPWSWLPAIVVLDQVELSLDRGSWLPAIVVLDQVELKASI